MHEGIYMFGTQKITAKMMSDKLVVKSGGSYMLIDEFLKANALNEMMATMVSNSPEKEKAVRRSGTGASPKRMAGSPKRSSFTATVPSETKANKLSSSPRAKTFNGKF
jgi:hypothetical protein